MPVPSMPFPASLSCRSCEIHAVSEPKSLVPKGKFGTALAFHVAHLQRSLTFEHEQAMCINQREFQGGGQQSQWRPSQADPGVASTQQSQMEQSRATIAMITGFPEALRSLADEQERALLAYFPAEPSRAQYPAGGLLHPRPSGVRFWTDNGAGRSPGEDSFGVPGDEMAPSPSMSGPSPSPAQGSSVSPGESSQPQEAAATPAPANIPVAFDLLSNWKNKSYGRAADTRVVLQSRRPSCEKQERFMRRNGSEGGSSWGTREDLSRLTSQWRHVPILVVSPNSKKAMIWSSLFTLMLFHDMVVFPMSVFEIPQSLFKTFMTWFSVTFWTADMVLSFCMGYVDNTGEMVLSHLKICKHYCRSWLVPDAMFLLTDWVMVLVDTGGSLAFTDVLRAGKILRCLRIFRILRIIRLKKMYNGMDQLDMMINSAWFAIVMRIMKNMLGILMCSHFVGCIWYYIGTSDYDTENTWVRAGDFAETIWSYRYLTAFHWALTQFTPGSMEVQPTNDLERFFAILVLVVGMVIFSSIISSITQATNSLKDMNSQYDKMLWSMRRYIRDHSISPDTAARVITYAERVIRPGMKKIPQDEVRMFRSLPETLYMDICLEIYDQDFSEHILFRGLLDTRRGFMQRISRFALSEAHFSKECEIYEPVQICNHMYFVRAGRMAYSEPCQSVRKTTLLGANEEYSYWFCEPALWTAWVHQGLCEARSESTLTLLDCASFLDVAQRYRSSYVALQAYGREFVKEMNAYVAENGGLEDDDEVGVISDLFRLSEEAANASFQILSEGQNRTRTPA